MISLSKIYNPTYDNVDRFYYQDIHPNTLFPFHDESPINFEVSII